MTSKIRYDLPRVSHAWLTNAVLVEYPSHNKPGEPATLIETLVLEYLKLWHLIIHYHKSASLHQGRLLRYSAYTGSTANSILTTA